jgi:hypothetical protein
MKQSDVQIPTAKWEQKKCRTCALNSLDEDIPNSGEWLPLREKRRNKMRGEMPIPSGIFYRMLGIWGVCIILVCDFLHV